MSYGMELRNIAHECEKRDQDLERLAFCYDVYLDFVCNGREPTEHMNPDKATYQLFAAVRNAIGLPPE